MKYESVWRIHFTLLGLGGGGKWGDEKLIHPKESFKNHGHWWHQTHGGRCPAWVS